MKTNARDPKYHPVLILNNNSAPNCAEIDYAEGSSVTSVMRFFLHYACGGADFQTTAATPVDGTQWHNYAGGVDPGRHQRIRRRSEDLH